jgi:hypothetical protein
MSYICTEKNDYLTESQHEHFIMSKMKRNYLAEHQSDHFLNSKRNFSKHVCNPPALSGSVAKSEIKHAKKTNNDANKETSLRLRSSDKPKPLPIVHVEIISTSMTAYKSTCCDL